MAPRSKGKKHGEFSLFELPQFSYVLRRANDEPPETQVGGRDTVKKQILEQLVSASACFQARSKQATFRTMKL